jgi:hypothetical protein
VTTGRYGETHVGYRDYAQSTSLNFERTAYCAVQFQISEIGAGLGRLDLNLQSSISAKPAARKTKKTRAIGLSAAAHIWHHVDAVESMGGGSIMWSALLRRQARFLECCMQVLWSVFLWCGRCKPYLRIRCWTLVSVARWKRL